MFAVINHRPIFYTTLGRGHPLFLPGAELGQNHTQLRPWLDQLATYAQLVYFTSQSPDYPTQLAEIDGLRVYLRYNQIMLFGFGFGGLLAQAFALHYPEYLAGLILCSSPVITATTAVVHEFDHLADCLHTITTPTLIIAGRHDTTCPPESTAERLHAMLPQSQLVVLDHSTHFPFQEEPERFATVVGKWLTRLHPNS